MKRLNRKGFTLVELLAVIVILAILVGIVLVTVLPTLSDFRQDAFDTTAQTAADFFEKQYQLYVLDGSSTISSFPVGTTSNLTAAELKAAGLKPENYVIGNGTTWQVDQATGRVCVRLQASLRSDGNAGGEFYDVKRPTAKSTACN